MSDSRHVNDFGNGNFIDLIRMLALYYFSIQSIQLKSLLFFSAFQANDFVVDRELEIVMRKSDMAT